MQKITKLPTNHVDNKNSIVAEHDIYFRKSEIILREIDAQIRIGKNVRISDCRIEVAKKSLLTIEDDCVLSGVLSVGSFSKVHIGKGLKVTGNLRIRAVESTEVVIGDDCLFATDVTIRTNDGHPIYECNTKIRINPSRSIYIGRHVWLGDEVIVLKGTKIGCGSIVGTRSIVTKDLPMRSLSVGIPAKTVKENVTWEHTPGRFTEDLYLPS